MEEEKSAVTGHVVQHLDYLLNEQIALFKNIVSDNASLQKRVEELEVDISGWKAAFKSAESEKQLLIQKVSGLERSVGSLKDDNPLLLCLIDGDGNIFQDNLLRQGKAGGRQAAMHITRGINDYMASRGDTDLNVRGQIWLTVYCNKSGLLNTLTKYNKCTVEEFENFILGFNQASPLFAIVDVGNIKEAADAKIKECLRVFTRFPQTSRVFFGGGHDNGYTSTLNYLENEGLLGKITILNGYKNLAVDLRGLNIPELHIEGVFMPQKLAANAYTSPVKTVRRLELEDLDGTREMLPLGSPTSPSQADISRIAGNYQPQNKYRLCTYYFIGNNCRNGDRCTFRHDTIPTPQDLDRLRADAKSIPCSSLNAGKICRRGSACFWAHTCPAGSRCKFYKRGGCKFRGPDMHDTPEYEENENRIPSSRFPPTSGSNSVPLAGQTPSLLMRLTSPGSNYSELSNADSSPHRWSHSPSDGPFIED